MPISLIAPTVVRYAMNHLLVNGRTATCIVDVSIDEFATSREEAVAQAAPIVVGSWQTNIANLFTTKTSFTDCKWLDLDSMDGISGTTGPQPGKPIHGNGVTATVSPNVAFLIHKHCTHNRAQRDGRLYLPEVGEAAIDDAGLVAGTYITALTNAFNGLKTDLSQLGTTISGASSFWRVVHRTATGWSSSDVKSISVDPRVATMRRRNR